MAKRSPMPTPLLVRDPGMGSAQLTAPAFTGAEVAEVLRLPFHAGVSEALQHAGRALRITLLGHASIASR